MCLSVKDNPGGRTGEGGTNCAAKRRNEFVRQERGMSAFFFVRHVMLACLFVRHLFSFSFGELVHGQEKQASDTMEMGMCRS